MAVSEGANMPSTLKQSAYSKMQRFCMLQVRQPMPAVYQYPVSK